MGIRLVQEVLHHAPDGLDTAARLVLVVIAQDANDMTRVGYPGMDVLARRSGLSPDAVQKVLRRLASHGLEVRVPLGKDKNGRLFFAARGRQSTYRVPNLRADAHPPIEALKPGPPSAHSDEKGRITGRERADERPRKGGPQSAPSPQDLLRSPQQAAAAAIVIEQTDATEREALAVVDVLQRERPDIRSLAAVLRHFTDEELNERVDALRGDAHRRGVREFLDWAATQPECVDFVAGGDLLRPDTNLPVCVACRKRKEADQ